MSETRHPIAADPSVSRGGIFATTNWSQVLTAQGDSPQACGALETLCQNYWFPIYALIRRRGVEPEPARDLTQDFFAKLLSKDGIARARRERGRFRSFLAQSVKNFLADEWDKARAHKRGGGQPNLSFDFATAEGRYVEPADHATPDREFDRRWATEILAEARVRFEQESEVAGQGEIVKVLNLLGDPDAPSLSEQATKLGLSVNTLKSHLHRARARHARIIRAVVAQTVSAPADVEVELRHLRAALTD